MKSRWDVIGRKIGKQVKSENKKNGQYFYNIDIRLLIVNHSKENGTFFLWVDYEYVPMGLQNEISHIWQEISLEE